MGRELVVQKAHGKLRYLVHETVSDGSPVTPEFPTENELVEHLVAHGTTMDPPWPREAAERFVRVTKSACTFVIVGGTVRKGYEV